MQPRSASKTCRTGCRLGSVGAQPTSRRYARSRGVSGGPTESGTERVRRYATPVGPGTGHGNGHCCLLICATEASVNRIVPAPFSPGGNVLPFRARWAILERRSSQVNARKRGVAAGPGFGYRRRLLRARAAAAGRASRHADELPGGRAGSQCSGAADRDRPGVTDGPPLRRMPLSSAVSRASAGPPGTSYSGVTPTLADSARNRRLLRSAAPAHVEQQVQQAAVRAAEVIPESKSRSGTSSGTGRRTSARRWG